MIKIFISLIFIVSYLNCYTQVIRGIIIDSISGEKIQYASIYIKDNPGKGTYSDENGYFNIQSAVADTICISNIGYRKIYVLPKIYGSITYYPLTRESKILPEVIIRNDKANATEFLSFGYHMDKKDIRYRGTLGGKIMVFIKPLKKTGQFVISNLIFSIAKPIGENHSKGIVRILLFDADSINNDGFGKSLLPDDEIHEVKNKTYLLKINLQKHDIIFPSNGLFMGLEWLGEKNSDSSTNISPFYFQSINKEFKTLDSFFGSKYYDPYLRPKNLILVKKSVPNFGLEIKKIN